MMDQNILDALNNVVQAVNTIRLLNIQLVDEPENIIQINNDLRSQKTILNNNNKILIDNKLSKIDIQQVQYDSNGYVIAPWPFSDEIEGTSQYYLIQNPPPEISIEQIKLNNEDLQQLLIFKQKQYNVLKNLIKLKEDINENT